MHHKTLYRTVTLAHANKSGGRKPPVVTRPRLQRRPPTHRRQSPEQLRKRLCKYVSATHGGLTPPLLGMCACTPHAGGEGLGWADALAR
mgnify:CR=1 FL=1